MQHILILSGSVSEIFLRLSTFLNTYLFTDLISYLYFIFSSQSSYSNYVQIKKTPVYRQIVKGDFIVILQTYFSNYSKEFRRVLINIREKCKTSPGDLDSEDWSNFQHSLRVIQTCGELIMHTEEFDSNVISNVMNTIGHLTSSASPTKELTSIFK